MEFPPNPRDVARLAVLIFFAILFLQSGINKIVDREGNRKYVQSVFSKTFLAQFSSPMFITLMILEVSAGVLCGSGAVGLVLGKPQIGFIGLSVVCLCFISLFFGLRISGDYPGAAALAGYFVTALFGLYLFWV